MNKKQATDIKSVAYFLCVNDGYFDLYFVLIVSQMK